MAQVNRGRQKIPLQKIENEACRSVTFSKRKSGILKKSSELCTLTDTKMTVIIRSDKNNTFSFGHPSVQAIVDRFLLGNPEELANTYITRSFLEGLNAEYSVLEQELVNCKQQKEVLARKERACEAQQQYKSSLDAMDIGVLESFETDLVKLHGIVAQRSQELQQIQAQVMHQDAEIGIIRGFKDFVPPTAAFPGSLH